MPVTPQAGAGPHRRRSAAEKGRGPLFLHRPATGPGQQHLPETGPTRSDRSGTEIGAPNRPRLKCRSLT